MYLYILQYINIKLLKNMFFILEVFEIVFLSFETLRF